MGLRFLSHILALQANRVRAVIANDLISQNATSNMTENQIDENWKSQIVISNFVRMGLRNK